MMSKNYITINGHQIDPANLESFKLSWEGDPAIPACLQDWWDGSDSISAFTSGSTGKPKQIQLNKKYAVESARATLDILRVEPAATALLSMPAQYIAGRMMMVRAIVGKLNLLPILPSSTPRIPEYSIDLAAFTPHQFQGILAEPSSKAYYKIRNILLGGSPVPEDLADQKGQYPGRIFETYGMTETYSHVALRMVYPAKESYFRAVGSTTFSITDDKLVIHAPHIGIESLPTNDIGELDGPTRFRWLGRADNVINSGGIKIHPETLERKLSDFIKTPFFITGLPDQTYGEKVVLIIERSPESTSENDIQNLLIKIPGKYEKPKSVVWVDKIILTPTGKINRKATLNKYNLFI